MTRLHRAASFTTLGAMLTISLGVANAQDHTKSKIGSTDRKFLMQAAQGGMAEVELGRLAARKGSTKDVKQFGRKMVDDHSKGNAELKALASQKGVTLPAGISAKDQSEKKRLSALSGAAFDKAYMSYMTKDHKHDIADFEKEVSNAKDSDVKNFAAKTLPTLHTHLNMAEKADAKAGVPSASGSADRAARQ